MVRCSNCKSGKGCEKQGILTVSYTHLDVYKRQGLHVYIGVGVDVDVHWYIGVDVDVDG